MQVNSMSTKSITDQLLCKKTLSVILLLFIGCLFLSSVIPPLKSPDEHDHIERAYLLSKGVIVLDRPDGKSSGGYVDSGLLKYLGSYLPRQGVLSAEEISSAGAIRWSGQRVYDPSPGTGYYFPVIYLPQTLGLVVGEWFDLSIDHSYRLARLFSLVTVALLLYTAFRLYPPPPLVLALIVIPMTLFQISSASLDGVSTALAIFSISAFLRIATDGGSSSTWVQYALALAIAVLASSRFHALPIFILLAATFFYTKNKRSLFLFAASALFVLGWTLFALKTTVDLRVSIGESTSNIVHFYLQNPFQFFSVVWQTLTNNNLQNFYYKSFFGILGWLDVPFPDRYYTYFAVAIAVIALLSVSLKRIKDDWTQRLLLLVASLISVLFIFFALLVTWSPHPAQIISGVQGRYFLVPSIILAYGMMGDSDSLNGLRQRISLLLVLCLFLFSIYSSVGLIINRYYLLDFKVEQEKIVLGLDDSVERPKMIPSAPLESNRSIELRIPRHNNDLGKVVRIGIFFGTHMRSNPGEAELFLSASSGDVYRQKFSLPDLNDNAYKYFRVPANHYTSGQIVFESGGGISVWEAHSGDGRIHSCLKLTTVQNQMLSVNGCP